MTADRDIVYLDHNATTAPAPEVVSAIADVLLHDWGNPSARNPVGAAARARLSGARAQVAALLGAEPNEVVFTSGATEANLLALHSALASATAPRRIAVSAIEHAGFLKACARLERAGVELVLLPVDAQGRVLLDALPAVLEAGCALVAVMAANNETGVLQPLAEIAALANAHQVPLHVDATQMLGKLAVDFAASGATFMSVSAHKIKGLKGCGALAVRKGHVFTGMIAGSQERGRRGGTENLPGIVAFGVAARLAQQGLHVAAIQMADQRDAFEAALMQRVPGVTIHGSGVARLPNTCLFSIAGISADRLLGRLERGGVFAAAGSACSAGANEPSHVLAAMGVGRELALGAVRISIGPETRPEDLARALAIIETTAVPERALLPAA